MPKTTAKAGKKNRKYGTKKDFCQKYLAEGRREKNKIKRLKRHLKRLPNDKQAQKSLDSLS